MFYGQVRRKVIEKLSPESFDSIINILYHKDKQNEDNEENQFLDKLSIDKMKQDNDRFFGEIKSTIFRKFNHRKHLIEKCVTIK